MNSKPCPTCGASVPASAPGGFCPACLLRGAEEPAASSHAAPSLEAVAAAFPQLEVLGFIGQGGMGFVYKVRQPSLDRIVALKILSPELGRDPAFEERFAREARVLGKLNHPNIVAVYEHGECGGFFYLIMEFVDGVNLRQAMLAERFTPTQALAVVPGICDALQAAHSQGVWHRDIKPENILLDAAGQVKIADFGIARILGDPERNFTLTRTGGQLGSAAYMAPEQHEKPHDVDHRADIYSLGVVIYEMLTGELPLGRFPAPSQRAAVDARIDEIVMRTLEKERELRQQSAAEVKTDVSAAAIPARAPDHPKPSLSPTILLHALLFALIAAIFLIVLPGFDAILREMGVPRHNLPRIYLFQTVIGLLIVPVLFGIDVGLCILARKSGGRRGLRLWSGAVILVMVSVVAMSSIALYLPLKKVIGEPGGPAPAASAGERPGTTSAATPATPAVPFLEWAQGEWVLDREETLRAIGSLIPDEGKRKLVLEKVREGFAPHIDSDRLKFLPDAVKSWQVGKLGVPVPADIPSFGKLTISPLPRPAPGSSSESLEVTLQLRMQGTPEVEAELRPSTFSKTKEGLLQWKFEYNGEKRLAVYRRSDGTETAAAASTDVESWNYTLRHLDAARLDAKMKANPQAGVATKVEAGVVTLTGRPEAVRPLATMLRAIDQPEVTDPLQLPLLNMPPDFFTRLAIPGLMTGTGFKDTQFDPAFFETLKRENITSPQLARALSAHVLELEKATFVNTGTPFESIVHTPGASTYYDGTIPCADQPDKPLTLRIRRTTQQIGTKPDIAGLAPWLIEEAKKQSKEPLSVPGKNDAKDRPAKPPATPAPDAKPGANAPAKPLSDVVLRVETKTSYAQDNGRGENRTVNIHADKPGYVHLWTPGGKRFTEALNDLSKVAHFGNQSTTGFYSSATYSLYEIEGLVFSYGIRSQHRVDLAKQNLNYADVVKGLHEVRDPTGICLRNTIYDLTPVGDSALLLAITDTAEPPPETLYFLHIWQPPLQHEPARLFECIPVRIGEMLITPGEPGKNAGNKLTGQRVGRISQRDGKYHASLQYSAGSTAMLNEPMTPEVPIAVRSHVISAGGMWPQFMLLSTRKDATPFLNEQFFRPATGEEIQQGTSLAQQAAQLAATKGKAWKSEVLDLRRANGVQYKSILILEFAPFAGFRENPPDASVKVSGASPAEGPFKVSVGIADPDFRDVRLEEKDGVRTIKITQAIESVDKPTKKTERILNDYRSMSFSYLLTSDTLTLKGFPTDEITWGSMGFIAPARDIVFKLTP